MFGKKKKSSVDEVFESVFGQKLSPFCNNESGTTIYLRNGIINNSPDQINNTLKHLGKDNPKTHANITEVIRLLKTT